MSRPRILAVAHETTRTGGPANLLHLMRWISANRDVDLHILVLRDGPLRYDFEEVADVTVAGWRTSRELLDRRPPLRPAAAATVQQHSIGRYMRHQLRHLTDFDVVYVNCIPSVAVLPFLPPHGAVVSHVHEMGLALEELPAPAAELLRDRPTRWIAASRPVADDLVRTIGVPRDRIVVHHEFIDSRHRAAHPPDPRTVERTRRGAGIGADSAVVVGCGTFEWRKGVDLFVDVVAAVDRLTRGPIEFVWVGGPIDEPALHRMRADLRRAGVADLIRFVGLQEDTAPWLAMADVFALCSREDPFPLVCLESAAYGTPVVTFRNGGIVDFLNAAGPVAASGVVGHLDVHGMARRIVELLESGPLHAAAADEARRRVLEHHDVGVGAPAVFDEIEGVLR